MKELIVFTCHCGKEYVPYRASQQKHCSHQCRDAYRYYKDREKRLAKDVEHFKKTHTREKGREQYAKAKERAPEKMRARSLMSAAIKRGQLVRQPCEKCGEPKVHGHHTDYSKPLDVMWLCRKHHYEEHRRRHAHIARIKEMRKV